MKHAPAAPDRTHPLKTMTARLIRRGLFARFKREKKNGKNNGKNQNVGRLCSRDNYRKMGDSRRYSLDVRRNNRNQFARSNQLA